MTCSNNSNIKVIACFWTNVSVYERLEAWNEFTGTTKLLDCGTASRIEEQWPTENPLWIIKLWRSKVLICYLLSLELRDRHEANKQQWCLEQLNLKKRWGNKTNISQRKGRETPPSNWTSLTLRAQENKTGHPCPRGHSTDRIYLVFTQVGFHSAIWLAERRSEVWDGKEQKARSHRKIEMGKEKTEPDSHGTKMECNWELAIHRRYRKDGWM